MVRDKGEEANGNLGRKEWRRVLDYGGSEGVQAKMELEEYPIVSCKGHTTNRKDTRIL